MAKSIGLRAILFLALVLALCEVWAPPSPVQGPALTPTENFRVRFRPECKQWSSNELRPLWGVCWTTGDAFSPEPALVYYTPQFIRSYGGWPITQPRRSMMVTVTPTP